MVLGPLSGTTDLAEADLTLIGVAGSRAGAALAADDLDADGRDDLVVGAPWGGGGETGWVYVVYGGGL